MSITSLLLPTYILPTYYRYTPEITESAPSWSQHGAEFGGLRVFSIIEIFVVRQVRVLPACNAIWAWGQTIAKRCTAREDRERIWFCVHSCVCGLQKPVDPKIEPHGWRRHYTWWYRRSGISVVYLCNIQITCISNVHKMVVCHIFEMGLSTSTCGQVFSKIIFYM